MTDVFPAHAGMSPTMGKTTSVPFSFPRTRGDEPGAMNEPRALYVFSPHTRG